MQVRQVPVDRGGAEWCRKERPVPAPNPQTKRSPDAVSPTADDPRKNSRRQHYYRIGKRSRHSTKSHTRPAAVPLAGEQLRVLFLIESPEMGDGLNSRLTVATISVAAITLGSRA
jgi:hypothetical protein